MAKITLTGTPANTNSDLPAVGSEAPDFNLTKSDLSSTSLSDYKGKKLILNIFPSIDTGTCAASVRQFNKDASSLDNVSVLCISKDLPFAQKRFCGAEGIDNVETLSTFRDGDSFANAYGVMMTDGPLMGLNARAVVAVDENGKVIYNQLVEEITEEPNYSDALAAVK